jgi:glycosyltransferase involved in cell wall biosynthesis
MLVEALLPLGFGAIVLVDDGNADGARELFDELAGLDGVRVVTHAVNLGKGRALKSGFNYCLVELPEMSGVVTADADGQHVPRDIARVADELVGGAGDRIVLGARGFEENVPLRSRVGNGLTRVLFGFVTGTRLKDTQTGLRGVPRALLPGLMVLEGERYEYEMTMLAHLCRTGKRPVEVEIETVYLDGNRSSHFDPIRDSMRIYFVLARFFVSSLVAAGIDFAGFSVAFAMTHHVLTSVVVGRLSSLVNYAINKRYVFQNEGSVKGTLVRYYLLVVVVAALSYGLIWTLTTRAHWNVFVAKVGVDLLLSLVSFSMQRTFVFRKTGLD